MARAQADRCALCWELLEEKAVVDHCHASGCVRALLHERCNIRVGRVEALIRGPQPWHVRWPSVTLAVHLERRTPWVADALRYLGECP